HFVYMFEIVHIIYFILILVNKPHTIRQPQKGETMSLFRNALWSRREVLKQSGILSALGAATAVSPLAAGATALAEPQAQKTFPPREGTDQDNLFTRIGVRPLINGRGTFTII